MDSTPFFDVEMEVLKEENLYLEHKHSPERPERPSSPADCAICLEQLKNKSFTNSCLHMFCFHCLEAWSKVKPECPLCKKDFCSIIHNIRSMTDYDEYHVPPVEPPRFTYTPPLLSPSEIADSYAAHEFFSNRRRFFSYRTTFTPNTYTIPRVRSSNLVIQPYIDNLQLEANFSPTNAIQSTLARSHRAEVYRRQLETRPPTTGRYRECSPEFYRENETQLHRLSRWLHRELLALSQIGVRFNVPEVKQIILDMLVLYNINSSIFHNILSQHFGAHTSRFVREFYNFATSPYEMDQYDRECVLVRPRNSSLSFIVTVGRDESEDIQVIPSPPLEEPIRPWTDLNRATPSDPAINTTGLRFWSRLVNRRATPRNLAVPTPTSINPSTSVINLTDSETEDCVILDDGPGPETIVLDDSDTDVESPPTTFSLSNLLDEDPYAGGHRPLDLTTSRSTSSQTSDPLPVELPAHLPGSNGLSLPDPRETPMPVENDPKLANSAYPLKRRRSCSIDSSVLSTCISSDESFYCRREKRCKRLCRTRSKRAAAHRRYSNEESWDDSTSEDADSDSDWETVRRKRKKRSKKGHTSKREKKVSSKKRKKATAHKSKKPKPSSDGPSADDSHRKSRPKREKTKSKRRARTPVEAADSPRPAGGSKLCSEVKVVHRNADSFTSDQPSTSSGYKGGDSRNDFMRLSWRNHYLSDSD